MANIHWSVWIALGAIVTAMSAYMGDRFVLFFWAGILMVVYGVFKIIVKFVTGESPSANKIRPIPKNPQISRCPVCRTSVYTTARFCHMCGAKLSQ